MYVYPSKEGNTPLSSWLKKMYLIWIWSIVGTGFIHVSHVFHHLAQSTFINVRWICVNCFGPSNSHLLLLLLLVMRDRLHPKWEIRNMKPSPSQSKSKRKQNKTEKYISKKMFQAKIAMICLFFFIHYFDVWLFIHICLVCICEYCELF